MTPVERRKTNFESVVHYMVARIQKKKLKCLVHLPNEIYSIMLLSICHVLHVWVGMRHLQKKQNSFKHNYLCERLWTILYYSLSLCLSLCLSACLSVSLSLFPYSTVLYHSFGFIQTPFVKIVNSKLFFFRR